MMGKVVVGLGGLAEAGVVKGVRTAWRGSLGGIA